MADDNHYTSETEQKIYELLNQSKHDLSQTEITERLDISEPTASKYLKALYHSNRITITRKVGHAVFYDAK